MAFNSANQSGLGDQSDQRANRALGSEGLGGHHHHQHAGSKVGEGLAGDYSDQGLGARSGVATGGVGQPGVGQAGVGQADNITGHGAQHNVLGAHGHEGVGGTTSTGNKPGMGDKIKGTFEEIKGKVTKDPVTQLQGEARKKGDLSGHQQVGLDGY
ncbi:hypothetical protein DFH28DRAFT_973877 [Melampsora americana]|nr:hypothetical protein DFH28DRAFT_973877 [Melampsora americana]